MRSVYLLIFWLVSSSLLFGQSLFIQSVPNTCADQEVLVTYSSSASFAPDNVFTVEVRGYYNDTYTRTFPATIKNGQIAFLIKDLNFPEYVLQNGLQARIASTNPVLRSEWSGYFYWYRRATVTLTAATVQTVNPFEPTGL